jgi:hypothetical protein
MEEVLVSRCIVDSQPKLENDSVERDGDIRRYRL